MATRKRTKREILSEKKNTKKLIAPHNISFYKSEKAYIDAVYRNNKEYIDSHVPTNVKASPQAFFRSEVMRTRKMYNQETKKNFTLRRAIRRVANSKMLNREWQDNTDVRANNFENLLKKDKTIYKEFRNKTRFKGQFTSFDSKKLKFDGFYTINNSDAAVYFYEDLVIIEYKSPQPGLGASIDIMPRDLFEETIGNTTFFISETAPKKGSEY